MDEDFLDYLLRVIVETNPVDGCIIVGDKSEWDDLPPEKTLFNAPYGSGLPIGNLSSQLFSNVYMNVFDQFCKRELKAKHYGRYVDDAFIVSADRSYLKMSIQRIRRFLSEELGLELNDAKLRLLPAGVAGQAALASFRGVLSHYACHHLEILNVINPYFARTSQYQVRQR